jgi:hypothetical protein
VDGLRRSLKLIRQQLDQMDRRMLDLTETREVAERQHAHWCEHAAQLLAAAEQTASETVSGY